MHNYQRLFNFRPLRDAGRERADRSGAHRRAEGHSQEALRRGADGSADAGLVWVIIVFDRI